MSGHITQNPSSLNKDKFNKRRQNSKILIRPVSNSSNRGNGDSQIGTETIAPKRLEKLVTRPQKRASSVIVTTSVLYLLRLLILGAGISAITGTILTVFDTTIITKYLATTLNLPQLLPSQDSPSTESQPEAEPSPSASPAALALTQEVAPLKKKLMDLVAKYPKLQPGAFFVDLDNGAYVDLNGETIFSAASTIKIPVLVAFFEAVDAGKIYLDEKLTMSKDVITGGSGVMQYQQVDKKFTALETATQMIVISDNTATDMLIKRLGGKEVLNERFREWGLTSTVINNRLPDLEGTNTTSPRDLAYLLTRVNQGELLSLRSRDRLMGIMQKTKTRTLLPQGLEESAIIAHKTGDIGTVLGDAGIIDMPTGKRYIGSVLVKRSHNDYTARTMIQEISRTVYQHFKWYDPRPEIKQPEATAQPSVQPSVQPIVEPSAQQ